MAYTEVKNDFYKLLFFLCEEIDRGKNISIVKYKRLFSLKPSIQFGAFDEIDGYFLTLFYEFKKHRIYIYGLYNNLPTVIPFEFLTSISLKVQKHCFNRVFYVKRVWSPVTKKYVDKILAMSYTMKYHERESFRKKHLYGFGKTIRKSIPRLIIKEVAYVYPLPKWGEKLLKVSYQILKPK